MSYITIWFVLMLAVVMGIGYKLLIKKGLYRNFIVYSVMLLWTAYLLGSKWYDWPAVTVISPITLFIAPLKRFMNIMTWMG
ncbi:hypothetical protein FHS16_000190 [Paenibacillus endophyticus]|uniref:Lycopene cyclase domain-containing protein n=1 Tax=Paenibacillus endophyticus TaxID=1294268 RepID=A0A7W5G8D3_9BACL|nr:hypothetical protein [Paenibacillus endophyticus]MBB3150158.1 hypothetical protein [Paenibacillus endophyticus]